MADSNLFTQQSAWDVTPLVQDVPPGARQAVNGIEIDQDQMNAGWAWPTVDIATMNTIMSQYLAPQVFTARRGLTFPDVGGPVGRRFVGSSQEPAYYFKDGSDGVVILEAKVVRADPTVRVLFDSPGTDATLDAAWLVEYELLTDGAVPGGNVISGGSKQVADSATANAAVAAEFPLTLTAADRGKRLWVRLTFQGSAAGNTLDNVDLLRVEVR